MMSLRTTKGQLTFVCFMSVTGGRSFVRRSCRRTLHFHFGRAIHNDTDSETEKVRRSPLMPDFQPRIP